MGDLVSRDALDLVIQERNDAITALNKAIETITAYELLLRDYQKKCGEAEGECLFLIPAKPE